MYNHNKAQQSSNRVHIFWDILYSFATAAAATARSANDNGNAAIKCFIAFMEYIEGNTTLWTNVNFAINMTETSVSGTAVWQFIIGFATLYTTELVHISKLHATETYI